MAVSGPWPRKRVPFPFLRFGIVVIATWMGCTLAYEDLLFMTAHTPLDPWLPPPPVGDFKGSYVVNDEIPGAGAVPAFQMKLMTDPTIDQTLTAYNQKPGHFQVYHRGGRPLVVHAPGGTAQEQYEMFYAGPRK